EGWNALATTGADAAPPMLACDPTAMKNTGARMALATASMMAAWMEIQISPTRNSSGSENTARMSMCMPMVATSTYRQAEPTVLAPAPSKLRARVNDSTTPSVVAITTTQKKLEVRL